MIGPNFLAPKAPVAEHWTGSGNPAVDVDTRDEHREWWSALNDPVLSKLVDMAYRQNLDLLAAGIRVLQARAQLGVAIGELYPQQQNASASVTRNRIPLSNPFNVIDTTYWQAAFGVQAGWEIDVWGKVRRGIQSADDSYLASVADYDDVLVTLTGDVASTYVQIRTLEAQTAIARQNVERQTEALDISQKRFKGGVVTERDVFQAENELGTTQASISELAIKLAEAKNALGVLLGVPPGQLDEVLAESSGIPVAPEKIVVGIPADLLRRRPDVRKAELVAAAQCAQIGFAKGDLLPAFSLVGNVGTVASDVGRADLGKVFTAGTLAYSAGPAVQWNILNYGQITNNVRVQDAKFQELLAKYQGAVLSAQKEVENGITKFVESRGEAEALRKAEVAAEGALDIAMIQYKDGIVDFTTVLQAEEKLFQTQNSLAVAQSNIPLGLIGAYRALGGGWQLREGEDFVPEATRQEMARRTDWGTVLTPALLRPQAPGVPSPDDEGPTVRPPEW
jgi:NodT family efflux transporter outer membrane factor (OMF) lipoprotein